MRGWFWLLGLCCLAPGLQALELRSEGGGQAPLGQWAEVRLQAWASAEEEGLDLEPPVAEGLYLEEPRREIRFEAGRWQTTWTWRALASEAGDYAVGPFEVTYRTPSGPQRAQAPKVSLEVVGEPPAKLPKSLGPLKPRFEPKYLIWSLSGFFALGLPLAFGLARRRIAPAQPPQSPADKALDRLDRLREQLEQGDLKELHVGLSEVLKDYLSEAFGKPVKGQTTEEFLASARRFEELNPKQRQALGAYFQLADQVKFAQYDPGRTLSAEALAQARELVEQGEG